MYGIRAIGGTLYLSGAILMAWNLFKTMHVGVFLGDEKQEAPSRLSNHGAHDGELLLRWI
jgi:cytochrome c oxidase cbb3-type subunit I/II